MPAGIHLPTSSRITFDGDDMPSHPFAALRADSATPTAASHNAPAIDPIPLITPWIISAPSPIQSTSRIACTTFPASSAAAPTTSGNISEMPLIRFATISIPASNISGRFSAIVDKTVETNSVIASTMSGKESTMPCAIVIIISTPASKMLGKLSARALTRVSTVSAAFDIISGKAFPIPDTRLDMISLPFSIILG